MVKIGLRFLRDISLYIRVRQTLRNYTQTELKGDLMSKGKVKWFNTQKGFGFIVPDDGGKDVFVHISAVERSGLRGLAENQVIEYELQTEKGKTAAVNLKVSG